MMLNSYIGVLSLNEDESGIKSLTLNRPLASIPIFGRYRVIDFVLSNMVNAGIKTVGIFGQNHSRSLIDHLGTGKSWDLNRKMGGLFIFNYSINNPPTSDVKLFKNNMEFFYRSKAENVILSTSRMISKIDLEKAAKYHEKYKNDITIVYKSVKGDDETFLNCDVLNMDENKRILSIGKIIGLNRNVDISMEIFIMKKDILIDCIYKSIEKSGYDSLKDYIYENTGNLNIGGYEYKGYLSCINSIKSYYKTSMDILDIENMKELFYKNGYVYTKTNDSPPTRYCNGSDVKNSTISNGCLIRGCVKNSIVSRAVKVYEGSIVEDSIIFGNCIVERNAVLKNVILDKNVTIEEGKSLIGDRKFPIVIEKGEVVKNLLKKVGGA